MKAGTLTMEQTEVSDEQLFIIMKYLWEHGVEKKRIKKSADVFYKTKSEQP